MALDALELAFHDSKSVNIRIDLTRDIPVTILGKYPSLAKKDRRFNLREIIYAEDFPLIADVFNDIVSGREKALNCHCRVNIGKDYHWVYLNCNLRKDTFNKSLHLTGSMIDVSDYLENASDDHVLQQIEKKNSAKIEAIKTDNPAITEILGEDYLIKIQSAFTMTQGLVSAFIDASGKFICSSDPAITRFDAKQYAHSKAVEIRYNHMLLANWVIASDSAEAIEKNSSLLDVLSQTVSQIANAMLILYNEMENSKTANQQLGSNIEQQILLNNVYTIILEKRDSDEALRMVIKLVGEYLKLDRIRLYSYDSEDCSTSLVREWAGLASDATNEKSFDCAAHPLLMEELNYCDTYFSTSSFAELEKLKVKSFVVSQIAESGKFTGLIFYEVIYGDRIWSNSDKKLLRNISQIISTMLIRCNMDTALKMQNEQLKKLAFTDPVIDISNRAALDRDLRAELEKKASGAAIALKITNMRSVNEAFGHIHSDVLLKKIAKFIDGMEVKGKRVYRFSGSVIIVILRGSTAEQAREFCENLLARFKRSWFIDGAEHYMEAIVGVTLYPDNALTNEDIYRCATNAMYRAGEFNKNSYAFYNDEFENDNIAQMNLEQRLRNSVFSRMEGFSVLFQPIAYLNDLKNYSYEAQIRWCDDVLGEIPVKKLIKTAENIGIDALLDSWVIGKACEFCKNLNEQSGRTDNVVTINLTTHELIHTPINETIRSALAKHSLSGDNLVVEVPEKAQIKAYTDIAPVLGNLRKTGVRVTIDDYGRDFTSLSSLKYSFVNIIKLNSVQFTDCNSDFDRIMLESVVKLAHERGILVAVKHVADESQYECLKKFGIDLIEGECIGNAAEVEFALRENEVNA